MIKLQSLCFTVYRNVRQIVLYNNEQLKLQQNQRRNLFVKVMSNIEYLGKYWLRLGSQNSLILQTCFEEDNDSLKKHNH